MLTVNVCLPGAALSHRPRRSEPVAVGDVQLQPIELPQFRHL